MATGKINYVDNKIHVKIYNILGSGLIRQRGKGQEEGGVFRTMLYLNDLRNSCNGILNPTIIINYNFNEDKIH